VSGNDWLAIACIEPPSDCLSGSGQAVGGYRVRQNCNVVNHSPRKRGYLNQELVKLELVLVVSEICAGKYGAGRAREAS